MCLIQDESVLVTGYIHRLVKELILLSVCKPIIIIIIIIKCEPTPIDIK